jgi:hypothetical protein
MSQCPRCEIKPGKRVNPKPRQPPRVYQRDQVGTVDDDLKTHEAFMMFLAICTTLGFATLCAVIA